MHLTPDELIDLAEGAPGEDAAAHVGSCQACRDQLAALTATMAAIRGEDVPEPPPQFWEHLSTRVHEAVAAAGAPDRTSGWRTIRPLSWSAAAIAAVAAAVAVAMYVTVPRDATPFAPAPTAPDTAVEAVLQPFGAADDPSLALVAELTAQMDPAAVAGAGWTDHAGGVDEMLANLTRGERLELQRLLKEALETQDAS